MSFLKCGKDQILWNTTSQKTSVTTDNENMVHNLLQGTVCLQNPIVCSAIVYSGYVWSRHQETSLGAVSYQLPISRDLRKYR
jgi:hypothetical protein